MKKSEILSLARKMNAAELETLIADLAEIRVAKEPAVPMARPLSGMNLNMQDDPSIEARRLKDGRIRLWLRSGGLGWLAFNLSIENGITMREYLIAHTDQDRMPALFGEGGGEGNAH